MSTSPRSRVLLRLQYEEAAVEYLRGLPPEHFMEATAQATQRKITLESLDLVHAQRPDVQFFNELLVQYPLPGQKRPGQVVPDNMVVVCDEPIKASGSYDVPLQPVRPFWMLEYVSRHNKRKDYEDNFQKYEKELKVPYFLLFYPDDQELSLFRLRAGSYRSVKPNAHGRLAIAPLDLEMALVDEWVRYWLKGELLPLPADLQRELDDVREQLRTMKRRVRQQARRAEEQARRAEEQARRAEELAQQAEAERRARLAVEQELARLRAENERLRNP